MWQDDKLISSSLHKNAVDEWNTNFTICSQTIGFFVHVAEINHFEFGTFSQAIATLLIRLCSIKKDFELVHPLLKKP